MFLVDKTIGKVILQLAWPVIMEMSWIMGAAVIVMGMVGHLGAVSLAAFGLSAIVQFSTSMIFAAAGTGAAAIVARGSGAGNWEDVRRVAGQALLLGGVLGTVLAAVGYVVAPWLFSLTGAGRHIETLASELIRISFLFTPLYLVLAVGNAVLRGLGKTKQTLIITSVSNTAALAVSYILIYGIGVPNFGVYGAAWGSGALQAIGGVLSTIVLARDERLCLRWRDIFCIHQETLRRIVVISIPAALEQLSMQGGRIIYTFMVAGVGTVQFAAYQIALQVESLSFMPGFGFSVAAMTLVGKSMGKGNVEQAAQYAWATNRIALAGMTVMGGMFFLFAQPLISLFIQDPEVIRWGALCVQIAALEQPLIAVTYVLSGALRGSGDTKWPMYITSIGVWLVRIPLVYLLLIVWQYNITAAWFITAGDFFVRSIILWWRFSSDKWKTMRV